jgi:hypothetical protein
MDLRGRALRSLWVLLAVFAAVVAARTAGAQLRGDVNCNGTLGAGDLTTLTAVVFDDASSECGEADVNADGWISAADVTALVDVLEAPVGIGPLVTFFGLTRADDVLLPQSGTNADGVPIFSHLAGTGFSIVVEGKPGSDGCTVGPCAEGTPSDQSECKPQISVSCVLGFTRLPDLQIEASNPLGNGSPAVCDSSGDNPGGIPGIFPVTFDVNVNPDIVNIVNDFACRFLDGGPGGGQPVARGPNYACVKDAVTEEYGFANPTSTVEFCASITSVEQFPPATDTTLTVRLRDVIGNVGPPAQIIVHVGP